MIKLGIINFGTGNLKSILQVFHKISLNIDIVIIKKKKDLKLVDKLILPGQSNISFCIKYLNKFDILNDLINFSKPVFGICVGKHLFFNKSEESSEEAFNRYDGIVKKFFFKKRKNKLPFIGWKKIFFLKNHFLFNNLYKYSYFYFSHSYYILPYNFENIYGIIKNNTYFSAIFIKDNILLTQFHPEKSSHSGLKLFYNFLLWGG